MSEYSTSRAMRYLPQVVVATTAVAVIPVAVVWWLHAEGWISSPWACAGLALALSLAFSVLGSAYWKRRSGPGDVFFSELMVWEWLHRLHGERRLANAVGLLGLDQVDKHLRDSEASAERKAKLLRQLAAALDAQDQYTDGHSRRVALHSAMVARRMGLPSDQVAEIQTAAAVHDIGKLRIPVEVLNKPGELTSAEFEIAKRHADEGAKIVACLGDPELVAVVRHHHERFDGGGYPSGLAGDHIPLGARIIAVADTFDALTSIRPYRQAISHKQALDVVLHASGAQLDPVVVRAFLRCYSGKRGLLFWTLLAVSPQRAVAWLRGKAPGQGTALSGLTVATPAAITAIAAAALATPVGVAPTQNTLRLAQRHPLQIGGSPILPPAGGPRRASDRTHASAAAVLSAHTSRSARKRGAGAGLTAVRSRSTARRLIGAGTRGGSSSGSPVRRGVSGTHAGRSGVTPVAGSGPAPGGSGSTSSATAPGAPPANGPGGGQTGQTNAGSNPPADGGGGSGGGGSGGSGGTNGLGGNGPGGGGGGSGGGSGGGAGGSGSGEPSSKENCKNGGYATYGFANQGQCVAYVERGPR